FLDQCGGTAERIAKMLLRFEGRMNEGARSGTRRRADAFFKLREALEGRFGLGVQFVRGQAGTLDNALVHFVESTLEALNLGRQKIGRLVSASPDALIDIGE